MQAMSKRSQPSTPTEYQVLERAGIVQRNWAVRGDEMGFASAFVRAEILAAMGLSALVLSTGASCTGEKDGSGGDSGETGDTGVENTDDYGACDPAEIDALEV